MAVSGSSPTVILLRHSCRGRPGPPIATTGTFEPKQMLDSQPKSPLTRGNAFAQLESARSWVQYPRGTRRFFSDDDFKDK